MGVTPGLSEHKRPHAGDGNFAIKPAVLWSMLLLIPLLAVFLFALFQPVKVRPRIGLAPGFLFTDQQGDRLTNEDLRGKLVFYNFTYTSCGERCQPLSATMHSIQELVAGLDTAGVPVELVTITFDAERDTPEQLKKYATQIGANTRNWHFLTGPAERLKNVIGGGFGVYYTQEEDGSFLFDPMFVLVDGNGIVRAQYKTAAPELGTIQRDLELIVTEIRNSQGAGKLVYEAAHLFLCYPKQ
ncbi:MAG: SCO family protein [Caldilineaceae bacterium]|nr:SCO family protein [Caldilineaceae bacterium]